ncbi:MAG: glycosyltransferase family 2 protein [Planctomycetota bacterium]|jgi:glycosyltransferase involved in cell wall biosynthesis
MRPKLSVIIPCKDERRNIRPCIESVRDIADEILVADSGSTDGTLDIVDDIGGCRVIRREYIDSGNFKNWAIPQAEYPWVLIIDADERVTEPLADEIRQVLDGGPSLDGYWIYRASYFMGRRIRFSGWQNDRVLRLFHRDLGRYEATGDHAEVVIPTDRVGRLRARLQHYTYWSYDQYFRKFNRYTKLQAERWHREGRRLNRVQLVLSGPLRFLRAYVLQLGFLDGLAGLQISALTGFYSFMKRARLWELNHGRRQPDPEAERARALGRPLDVAPEVRPSEQTVKAA